MQNGLRIGLLNLILTVSQKHTTLETKNLSPFVLGSFCTQNFLYELKDKRDLSCKQNRMKR